MIKFYCDICKKEFDPHYYNNLELLDKLNVCNDCNKKIEKYIKKLKKEGTI